MSPSAVSIFYKLVAQNQQISFDHNAAALLAAYGQNSSQFDYNRDGVVDGADLGILGGQATRKPTHPTFHTTWNWSR
jgi:hypothetical protein